MALARWVAEIRVLLRDTPTSRCRNMYGSSHTSCAIFVAGEASSGTTN